jgi:hypothetical protein
MAKKILPFVVAMSLSSMVSAQVADEPTYDCTAEETQLYIEQVSRNLFAPSPISSPTAFGVAYVDAAEAKAAAGDSEASSCASIFTDGGLEDGWKEITKAISEFDLGYDFSGLNAAALKALLEKAKEKAQEEFTKALDALGEDICNMISTDALEGMLLDAVNAKYGMNAQNLRMADFADEITDDVMASSDDDVLMLLSEDKLKREVSSESRSKMREIRKDLWNKL